MMLILVILGETEITAYVCANVLGQLVPLGTCTGRVLAFAVSACRRAEDGISCMNSWDRLVVGEDQRVWRPSSLSKGGGVYLYMNKKVKNVIATAGFIVSLCFLFEYLEG